MSSVPIDPRVPEDQVNGFVVIVLHHIGPSVIGVDAYGPHGEPEAHDMATIAVRGGYPTFLLNVETLHAERYTGEDAGP